MAPGLKTQKTQQFVILGTDLNSFASVAIVADRSSFGRAQPDRSGVLGKCIAEDEWVRAIRMAAGRLGGRMARLGGAAGRPRSMPFLDQYVSAGGS